MNEAIPKLKALIVDDSSFVRNQISRTLLKANYEVVGMAGNGREAVEMYRELRPDFITMDLHMPELEGIPALEEIRKFDPSAKIIILSAVGYEEKIEEALSKGAIGYILKPFKEKELLIDLADFLNARG